MTVGRPVGRSVGRPVGRPVTGYASGSAFSPADLFADGSTGTFLDFKAGANAFTDFIGTEATTGQALTLVLDQSQGAALGAEIVADPNFESGITGWVKNGDAATTLTYNSGTKALDISAPTMFDGAALLTATGVSAGAVVLISVSIQLGTATQVRIHNQAGTPVRTITSSGTYSIYTPVTGDPATSGIKVDSGTSTGTFSISFASAKVVAGNHYYQNPSASRAALGTDAGGKECIQPDGTDDYGVIPTSTIDYTGSVSVFVAYSLDQASSDSGPALLVGTGTEGIAVTHDGVTREARSVITEAGSANTSTLDYTTALTDAQVYVRADIFEAGVGHSIEIDGVEVASAAAAYAALDQPAALNLFGLGTANNIAGNVYTIVLINRLLTGSEKASLVDWMAARSGA